MEEGKLKAAGAAGEEVEVDDKWGVVEKEADWAAGWVAETGAEMGAEGPPCTASVTGHDLTWSFWKLLESEHV